MKICKLVGCAAWLVLLWGCTAPEPSGTAPAAARAADLPPLSDMEVPVKEPSEAETVTVGIGVDPGSVAPGAVLTVAVRARMATGWHIYAVDQPTDVQIPTTLDLQLPEGVEPVGEWDIPESQPLDATAKAYAYDNSVTFRRHLRVDEKASPGLVEIKCQFGYQSCTERSCLEPAKTVVSVALEVAE